MGRPSSECCCCASHVVQVLHTTGPWKPCYAAEHACSCCSLPVMHVRPDNRWVLLQVGGFLSFNLILPSDEPNIARLIG